MDNPKEQVPRDFCRKLKEADCHLKQTEPYLHWKNTAEGAIHKLTKGSSRHMIKTGSPKKLWDHSIELQAFIWSHTSNVVHILNSETTEMFMKGETADTSRLCEFAWYEWAMFRNLLVQYPNDFMILGHYLWPSLHVGSHRTYKILKSNE